MPSTTTQRKLISQFIAVTNATKENAQQVWPGPPLAPSHCVVFSPLFRPDIHGPLILSASAPDPR